MYTNFRYLFVYGGLHNETQSNAFTVTLEIHLLGNDVMYYV